MMVKYNASKHIVKPRTTVLVTSMFNLVLLDEEIHCAERRRMFEMDLQGFWKVFGFGKRTMELNQEPV